MPRFPNRRSVAPLGKAEAFGWSAAVAFVSRRVAGSNWLWKHDRLNRLSRYVWEVEVHDKPCLIIRVIRICQGGVAKGPCGGRSQTVTMQMYKYYILSWSVRGRNMTWIIFIWSLVFEARCRGIRDISELQPEDAGWIPNAGLVRVLGQVGAV